MSNEREKMLEALLFESGDGYTVSRLSEILGYDRDEVEEGISDLAHSLKTADRGIRLIRKGDKVALVSSKEVSDILRDIRKDALSGPLSPAALETLTIVLYLGPVEKKNIDYIRGVNSQGMLRTLRARDLVEYVRTDGVVHYTGTLSLLRFLGVGKAEDLPDFERIRQQFEEALQGEIQSENE